MTDYSKLKNWQLDIEINKILFPNHTYGEDHKGNWRWDGKSSEVDNIPSFVNDAAFCMKLITAHEMHIKPHHYAGTYWEVCVYERKENVLDCIAIGINKNTLNRAILECYLQTVEAGQAVVV